MKKVMKFFKEEKGVTAIEYALIAAGIAIAIVLVVFAVGSQVFNVFESVRSHLTPGEPITPGG